MLQLDAKITTNSTTSLLKHLNNAINNAIASATMEAGKYVEAQIAKEIKAELSLSDDLINDAISIKPVHNGVEIIIDSDDVKELEVSNRRHFIPIIKFQPRQVKSGVSIKIKGKRKVMRSAFIATMPKTGYKGIFRRVKIGATRVPRYPIKEIKWSTGIETVAADKVEGVAKSTITRFKVQLQKDLNKNI